MWAEVGGMVSFTLIRMRGVSQMVCPTRFSARNQWSPPDRARKGKSIVVLVNGKPLLSTTSWLTLSASAIRRTWSIAVLLVRTCTVKPAAGITWGGDWSERLTQEIGSEGLGGVAGPRCSTP